MTSLLSHIPKRHFTSSVRTLNAPLGVLFPGQGAQAGTDLTIGVPATLLSTLDAVVGYGLSGIMENGPEDVLTQTQNLQPALLTCSVASVSALRLEEGPQGEDSGVGVSAVAGHSLGEYSALCVAGSLTFEDAVRLVAQRGLAMRDATEALGEPVAMSALFPATRHDELRALCADVSRDVGMDEAVCVANINSSSQIVVSGLERAVEAVEVQAKAAKLTRRAQRLRVSAPFHSPLMQPAADVMAKALSSVTIRPPSVPVISNVTARPTEDPADIARLLVDHVTQPVDWLGCMQCMADDLGVEQVVEAAPGTVLSSLAAKFQSPSGNRLSVVSMADVWLGQDGLA